MAPVVLSIIIPLKGHEDSDSAQIHLNKSLPHEHVLHDERSRIPEDVDAIPHKFCIVRILARENFAFN
jgi:hypothetical protein